MAAWKLYILPCLLALAGAGLLAVLARSLALAKQPLQFGQATVVEKHSGKASFELFDGEIIVLTVEPKLLAGLHEGDYGRLTYRAGKLIRLER